MIMRAERLQRILYLLVVFGVLGVSSVGAQGYEQSFVLRALSQPETPVDYDIGALLTIDPATRGVIEAAMSHLVAGDIDAFLRLLSADSRHRLGERFYDLMNQSRPETTDEVANRAVGIDSLRIAPVQSRTAMEQTDTGSEAARRGYSVRLIQGNYATRGEVWVVMRNTGPIIDDVVIDFGSRTVFGDDTRKFAPGGARTIW